LNTERRDNSGQIARSLAGAEDAGVRLDRFLVSRMKEFSRSRLKQLLLGGNVRVNGKTIGDPAYRVNSGEAVELHVPPAAPARPRGEKIPLDVVFEDDALIVIDKPAGLVVHPAAGNAEGTLVNALIAHCGDTLSGIGGEKRPGIVHRLDKDTSGLMVAAKTDRAHRALAKQFADHGRTGALERGYLALVWGVPAPPRGAIDSPIGRDPRSRQRMAVRAGGRRAVTRYELRQTFPGADGKPLLSLIECRLETGRTHQIRVHLARAGHPLLGDPLYGTGFRTKQSQLRPQARDALAGLRRQALHAFLLGFTHPETGKPMRFESPLPADLARLVAALKSA
jgi:23S rRNA pseudouridine1911/1915/1917 synthase